MASLILFWFSISLTNFITRDIFISTCKSIHSRQLPSLSKSYGLFVIGYPNIRTVWTLITVGYSLTNSWFFASSSIPEPSSLLWPPLKLLTVNLFRLSLQLTRLHPSVRPLRVRHLYLFSTTSRVTILVLRLPFRLQLVRRFIHHLAWPIFCT